jgi:hypothetical protein
MNNLAPELLAAIVSQLELVPQLELPLSKLSPYSTVSRQWQFAVERHTFCCIRLKSTDLEHFSNLFRDHRRREILAAIDYHVILPTYSDKRCAKFETAKDRNLNNEAFTEAFHGLFRILHSWEQDSGTATSDQMRGCPIELESTVYSPMDYPYRKNHREKADSGGRRDLFERRYEYSVLRLLKDDLPMVSRISRFELLKTVGISRAVEGAALAAIAAKLPNLQLITWQLNDNDMRFPSLRQQRRYGI